MVSNVNYSNPWREKDARAAAAVKHTKEMEDQFPETIRWCIENTKVQGERPNIRDNALIGCIKARGEECNVSEPEISVVNLDTVTAAFLENSGKIAVLNFASYKNPGGMFLQGSIAQEEALCHESALYNILSSDRLAKEFYEPNRKRLNRALYHDNLLYTPAVPFIHNGAFRRLDVITCAAPNKGAAQKYKNVPDQECDDVMRMRIRSILIEAAEQEVDTLILGAYGCGVFKNDPKTVAQIFKEELANCPFKVVFAVPGDKYAIFKSVLTHN